jgi:hypothetical protein
MSAPNSLIADVAPPAERRNLTYEPQGEPMGLRVGDGGRSEGLPVMGGIGVELGECAVRAVEKVHHPTRKRADFHLVARHEKAWQTALKGEGR